MARVVITADAGAELERFRRQLTERGPDAARRAARAIETQLLMLESRPEIGRPLSDNPELRELPIPIGDGGYVALYRHLPGGDAVHVLAVRPRREAGS